MACSLVIRSELHKLVASYHHTTIHNGITPPRPGPLFCTHFVALLKFSEYKIIWPVMALVSEEGLSTRTTGSPGALVCQGSRSWAT
jgi:hypothetical protein